MQPKHTTVNSIIVSAMATTTFLLIIIMTISIITITTVIIRENVCTNNDIETAVKSLYTDVPVYWALGFQNQYNMSDR